MSEIKNLNLTISAFLFSDTAPLFFQPKLKIKLIKRLDLFILDEQSYSRTKYLTSNNSIVSVPYSIDSSMSKVNIQ